MTAAQSLSEALVYPAQRHRPLRVKVTTEFHARFRLAMENVYGVLREDLPTFCGVPVEIDDSIAPAIWRIVWEERELA